eukprot:1012681-Pyramimonas_sp.AAC.1
MGTTERLHRQRNGKYCLCTVMCTTAVRRREERTITKKPARVLHTGPTLYRDSHHALPRIHVEGERWVTLTEYRSTDATIHGASFGTTERGAERERGARNPN